MGSERGTQDTSLVIYGVRHDRCRAGHCRLRSTAREGWGATVKATLCALIVAMSLLVPLWVVGDAVVRGESRAWNAGMSTGTAFDWPDVPVVADPDITESILAEAVIASGVGVSRMSVETTESGRTTLIYYLYLGRKGSPLLGEFTLREGRWLTSAESTGERVAVASTPADGVKVVGAPRVLGNAYDLEFRPLDAAFDRLPSAGTYVIDSQDDGAVELFLSTITDRLGSLNSTAYVEIHPAGSTDRPYLTDANGLWFVPYAVVPVIAGLGLAVLTREAKRVGVLRLHGFSIGRSWFEVLGKLEIAAFAAGGLLSAVVLLLVPGTDVALAFSVAASFSAVVLVGLCTSLLFGAFMITRIHVADLVKGAVR
ncbi:MAG TPA: hypothetical protein VFC82_05395 [Actinomycetaceae bacterium]|nr:hypothetical protein [Actinomycetaceae bacterium]